MKKSLLLLLLLFGSLNLFAEDSKEKGFFSKVGEKIVHKVEKVLEGAKLDYDLDLLDFDLHEGVNTAVRYHYEFAPSYIGEQHTRFDKYTFDLRLSHGDALDLGDGIGDLPVSFNVNPGFEVLFARQFPDFKKAATRLPYGLKNLPLTTERALKKLNVGDFVRFKTHLNIIVGASSSTGHDILSYGVYSHYILSGQFQVHIYRMSKDRIRFRLFAFKTRQVGGGAEIEVGPEFSVFGVSLIDDEIEDYFQFDLVDIDLSKLKDQTLMADYIFDLKDEKTANAYDAFFKDAFQLKNIIETNPLQNAQRIKEFGLMSLDPIEELFEEQQNEVESGMRSEEERTIIRKFLGEVESNVSSRNSKFKLLFTQFENKNLFSKYRLSSTNNDGSVDHYVYSSFLHRDENKFEPFLLDIKYEKNRLASTNVLFHANEEGELDRFEELTFTYELQDRVLRKSEQKRLMKKLKRSLPLEMYSEISWDLERRKRLARAFYQVTFHNSSLKVVENISRSEIKASLERFLKSMKTKKVLPLSALPEKIFGRLNILSNMKVKKRKKQIAKYLSRAFNSKSSGQERLDQFEKLRKNKLFQDLGSGFLVYLLRENNKTFSEDELFYVKIKLTAKDREVFELTSSDESNGNRTIFHEVEYLESIVSQREFNLRLISAED
jgi:hypothetical protein